MAAVVGSLLLDSEAETSSQKPQAPRPPQFPQLFPGFKLPPSSAPLAQAQHATVALPRTYRPHWWATTAARVDKSEA